MKLVWIALVLFAVACSDDKGAVAPTQSNNSTGTDTGTGTNTGTTNNEWEVDCTVDGCASGLLCNENTGQCVNCQFDTECGSNAECMEEGLCACLDGFHPCDDRCVSSSDIAHCGNSCDPCEKPTNGIATCDGNACGVHCEAPLVIFGNQCVTCASDTHCTNPNQPRCDAGICVSCTDDTPCSKFPETKTCSAAGACVECESDTDCSGHVCIKSTGTCTNSPPKSIGACLPCEASASCIDGYMCMPMTFKGDAHGNYCLPTRGADACPSPWVVEIQRKPIDGVLTPACSLNEDITTCEGVLGLGDLCLSGRNSDCGAPGLDDARCEPVGFSFDLKCTYTCTSSSECRPTGDFELDEMGCISADYCGGA